MRPPLSYYGGKTLLAPRIAPLLPPHKHYVEPFCGGLSVLLAKQPSKMETVNDLDHELITFWRMLRDRPIELARLCALTPHSRAEYGRSHDRAGLDELETARRVWVCITQGRGSILREDKVGWRQFINPDGSSLGFPGYLAAYVERMASVAARLIGVSLECLPALDIIHKYGAHAGALLYIDPPYLGDTRNRRHNYRFELKTEAEHRELAEALRDARATVVISGYPSDLYDRDLFHDWERTELKAFTGNGRVRERVEVLWSNRDMVGAP